MTQKLSKTHLGIILLLTVGLSACSGSRSKHDLALDDPQVLLGHVNHVVLTSNYKPKHPGRGRARAQALVENKQVRRSVFGRPPPAPVVADNRYAAPQPINQASTPLALAQNTTARPPANSVIYQPRATTAQRNPATHPTTPAISPARQQATQLAPAPRQQAAAPSRAPTTGRGIRLPTVNDLMTGAKQAKPAQAPASVVKRQPAVRSVQLPTQRPQQARSLPVQQARAQQAHGQSRPARLQKVALASQPSPRTPQQVQRSLQTQQAQTNRVQAQTHWGNIVRGYRLPASLNQPKVQAYLTYYQKKPKQINVLSQRAAVFIPMIMEKIMQQGMPTELALLPFVESGFQLKARSHAGAAGLWQFIPETGRRYGLQQHADYDGRLNAHTSTKAALAYLQDLQQQFAGDWLLALAAYNCGEERVRREVAKNMKAGKPIDFWSLALPKETRNYVPRLLAYREIVKHPAKYGIQLHPANQFIQLHKVAIKRPVDLEKLSEHAGLPKRNLLMRLNPGFKRGVAMPRYDDRIVVPAHYRGLIERALLRMQAG